MAHFVWNNTSTGNQEVKAALKALEQIDERFIEIAGVLHTDETFAELLEQKGVLIEQIKEQTGDEPYWTPDGYCLRGHEYIYKVHHRVSDDKWIILYHEGHTSRPVDGAIAYTKRQAAYRRCKQLNDTVNKQIQEERM